MNARPHANPGKGAHAAEPLLIVEDDGNTIEALERLLNRLGHRAIAVRSMADALAFLDGPDVRSLCGAVVDVHLPDGDGIELTRRLRAHLGDEPPIVIVSGDTSMETLGRLRDAGADRFVGKPMSLTALKDALWGGNGA